MSNNTRSEQRAVSRRILIKKILVSAVLLLSIAAIVIFLLAAYSSRTDYTLRFVSRVLVIIAIVAFLALGIYVYAQSRNYGRGLNRRVILIATSSDYARADTTVIKAVDPRIEAAFWRAYPDTSHTFPEDRICSVCLSTVDPLKPGALGSGQAACCKGWFHKYCVLQYWQTNGGTVICPNCRHDGTETSS
jgi:hypothetical protein